MNRPDRLHPILLVTLILTPALVTSQLTIPHRALGYVYKTSNASSVVTLTAYMDLTCIDSKHAYPTLIKVADMLQLQGANFELVFRSFSLPFHRNSHMCTEGLHVIADSEFATHVFPYITGIYEKLDDLVTDATRDETDYDVLNIIAGVAADTTGIPAGWVIQNALNPYYDKAARLDFEYGCTRGVHGTPTFMLNDVVVEATPTWTVDQWMDIIKPLF